MEIWWGVALADWLEKNNNNKKKQQLWVQVWLNSCCVVVLQHRKPGFTLALEGVRRTRRRWMLLASPRVQSLFLHTHRGKQEVQQGIMWNRFDYSVAKCFALPSTAADQHATQDIVSWRGEGEVQLDGAAARKLSRSSQRGEMLLQIRLAGTICENWKIC